MTDKQNLVSMIFMLKGNLFFPLFDVFISNQKRQTQDPIRKNMLVSLLENAIKLEKQDTRTFRILTALSSELFSASPAALQDFHDSLRRSGWACPDIQDNPNIIGNAQSDFLI